MSEICTHTSIYRCNNYLSGSNFPLAFSPALFHPRKGAGAARWTVVLVHMVYLVNIAHKLIFPRVVFLGHPRNLPTETSDEPCRLTGKYPGAVQRVSGVFPPPSGHVAWRRRRGEELARPGREGDLRAKQLVTNWIISYYAPKDP
jgi:hypothetical protein